MINLIAMHVQRFFSYLSAFAGFMLFLVTGGNYFVLFVGWEGIGIVSYLLISYFYSRIQATKAALLAFTMNRLGDMGLSIGFFALFALFGTIEYSTVFTVAPYLNENAITIISLLLFSGAMAKSAQVPLSTWLPYSMEASLLLCCVPFVINLFSAEDLCCVATQTFNILSSTTITLKIRDEKGRFLKGSLRDAKGRFISAPEEKVDISLTKDVLDVLVGSLLGDGSLRYNKKDKTGRNKGNTNCSFAITLKSKEYIFYLWKLLGVLCTQTEPRPWPNPSSGLEIKQYTFSSRSVPVLSEIYEKWYKWDDLSQRYIKKVPLDIKDLLNEKGLAIWIMDDGFKVNNGVGLATESFTEEEVDRLKFILESKFGLLVTKNPRKTKSDLKRFRLFISAKSRKKLHSLVLPFFIPNMLYKLNL